MKKIFSLFAAVLMAGSMMAQFDTWSVVGSKAIMNGTADWAIAETANDMATEDGVTYTLTVTGKTLEVGTTYEYKYAKGHAWTVSIPQSGNLSLTVTETAVYDIVYTVNVSDQTHSAVATKAGEAGEITHVYSIAGDNASLFGAAWSETNTATEMTKGEDGIYSWTKDSIELTAGTILYKVVVDHAWGESYPSQNATLVIAEAGTYNVVVTFNPADKAVNATATKVGGEPGPGPDPEATLDTLYLVNSKGWGGPKIHLWGGTATGTTWPGVAMVKVNGVQADGFDVYMYSYNHGDYAKCIFNNGGSVKSGDLVIAGNEGKYFNFADQTWYESAEAVVCTWYLNANYNGTTEWRELTRGEGTFTRRDVYAPATNYYYNGMAADNLKSEIKGGNLTIDSNLAAGDSAVFTLNPYAKTINITKITGSNPPAPTINYYLAGSMNTPEWGSVAMPGDSIVLDLEAGEYGFKVQTAAGVWDGAFTYDNVNAECSSEGLYTNGDRNVMFTLAEAGEVKIKVVEGAICVTGAFQVQETYNYYLAGTMNSWGSTGMDGDSIVLNLEAGEHQFKIQLVAGYWDTALGFADVDIERSSEGLSSNNDGNVVFTLEEAGEVKIKMVEGKICVTLPASGTTTGINNIEAGKAVKMIENGHVVIIRDGKRYNAVGAQL